MLFISGLNDSLSERRVTEFRCPLTDHGLWNGSLWIRSRSKLKPKIGSFGKKAPFSDNDSKLLHRHSGGTRLLQLTVCSARYETHLSERENERDEGARKTRERLRINIEELYRGLLWYQQHRKFPSRTITKNRRPGEFSSIENHPGLLFSLSLESKSFLPLNDVHTRLKKVSRDNSTNVWIKDAASGQVGEESNEKKNQRRNSSVLV